MTLVDILAGIGVPALIGLVACIMVIIWFISIVNRLVVAIETWAYSREIESIAYSGYMKHKIGGKRGDSDEYYDDSNNEYE